MQSALAILEFLRSVDNEPMTLSAIARGTGLNVSTCFNILKTLETEQHEVVIDPAIAARGRIAVERMLTGWKP